MDRADTLKILGVLRVAYPNFYKSMDAEDYADTVLLWNEMFKDDSVQVVGAAVKTFIATDEKGFPPHIGAIRAAIAKITTKQEMTEMEAWNIVKGAISCYANHDDFLALPPAIQRAVGSSSQLCQWAMLDMSSLPVIMSNFMRSYRAAADSEREKKLIPKDVLALVAGMKTKAIGCAEDKEQEL